MASRYLARAGLFLTACFIVCTTAIVTKDIERNINILDFEMKILRRTLLQKQASLEELRNCLSLANNISVFQGQGIKTRPIISLLAEIKELSRLEKHLYGSIRRKFDDYYPPQIQEDGPGDSSEMLQSLQRVFKHFTTITEGNYEPRDQCDVTSFEDRRQWRHIKEYSDHEPGAKNCSNCDLVLPDGRCIVTTWQYLKYCENNGEEIRRIRLSREPYNVAYYKDDILLVEYFIETAKVIKMVNLTSGRRIRQPFSKLSGRRLLSGLSVYDGNVFIKAKHRFVDVHSMKNRYYTEIYKHDGRLHFKDFDTLTAEAGSPFGAIFGEIMDGRTAVIRGSGEIICVIDFYDTDPHTSDSGFVNNSGFIFLPGRGNNKMNVFDNDCIPTGDVINFPPGRYTSEVKGYNDTLFVKTSNSPSGWSNHVFTFA